MKRFLLFAGESYYPFGGATDLVGSFDSVEEAEASLDGIWSERHKGCDWAHTLDTVTGRVAAWQTTIAGVWECVASEDLAFAHPRPGLSNPAVAEAQAEIRIPPVCDPKWDDR